MNHSTESTYSNQFKAKVALQAYSKKAIDELSEKHSIPVSTIKNWVNEVEARAELLFNEQDALPQNDAIQSHAALLRTTLEASPNGILVTDLNRNIITHNRKCAQMWEIPPGVVARGKMEEVMQYILPVVKHSEEFRKGVQKLYAHPDKTLSDTIKLKDGRFFERHSTPYKVEGKTIGRVTNFVDITEYKRTEKKLFRFANLLDSINTNVNEGILRSTPDQGLVYVNDAFVEIFGYDSKEEVLATDPVLFYANEAKRKRLVDKLIDEKKFKNEEVLFRRKDGSTFWGLENSILVKNDDETYIDGVITNIDDWKKAQQELEKSEKKYRSILRNIEEGYFETDLEGNFTFFNAALVHIMGYTADELAGMNNRSYMSEEEAKKVFETFNRVYRTGEPEQVFDWKLIRGDGSRIYVEASITLRHDSGGNASGFSGMVRDVTERKRKEQQIRNSLKEKEVLLGEIHHRVKNNLAVISGLLYLQADKTADSTVRKALMQSQNRINSIALIHELLYDNQTFASLNPSVYIEQLVAHISANMSSGETDIETSIHAQDFDLEMSTAIPCALIINELITNAYKYAFDGRDKGTVTVGFHKNENAGYTLTIADNGVGLPPHFSIENKKKHSLGLSLVKTLTRQLNGELSFENDSGTTFIISFPEPKKT